MEIHQRQIINGEIIDNLRTEKQEFNMKRKYTETGQALVLIAFAAVALFGFAALAIDGSRVYSDRRHAQNAADTAALAGALSKAKGDNYATYTAAAWVRASSNGYDNNGTTNTVFVNDCSDTGIVCQGLPVGAVAEDYIRVQIVSTIPTTFARVLGRQTVTSVVEAVVHTVPSVPDEMFAGHAVVGLAPTECPGIKFQGNAETTVTGGGLFTMSNCSSAAFFNNSGSAQLTAPSICAVGNIPPGQPGVTNVPSVQSGCEPPPGIIEPDPTCSGAATWDESTGVMTPGSYSGHFPPNRIHTLLPGTYCVDGDFRVNGGAILTGVGVTIRMDGGGIDWGGAGNAGEIHLSAPTSPPNNGLLIYMPSATNCSTIKLNGNSASTVTGSILAPCSNITVNGTGDSGINGQLIGYTVDLGGTNVTNIHYQNSLNFDALTLPILESTQ